MVENLYNDSLIAKRIVHDHVKSKDLQSSKIKIIQKIHCSSTAAYSKYKAALENKKKNGLRDKQGKLEVIDRD